MNDISGTGTKRTTNNETLFPDLKEDHENHPNNANEQSDQTAKKKGHPQSLKQKWKAISLPNKLSIIFTALIFVATTAYAAFSGYQLSVMKRQLNEMKGSSAQADRLIEQATAQAKAADTQSKQAIEQTNKMGQSLDKTDALVKATAELAIESRRQANVARDALDTSSKTFRLDQRPWVMGSRFQMLSEPEENKPFTVRIYMTNTGKTVAINALPQSRAINWHEEPPPIIWSDPTAVRSRGIVTPGSTAFSFETTPLTLDSAQLMGYKFGTYKIYIQARVSYTDIFEAAHWTTLCIFHESGKPLEEWNFCQHGNDADH